MLRWILLLATHLVTLTVGFALGIYALPILIAPPGPDVAALQATRASPLHTGHFNRNLAGSDLVHWGEGEVRILPDRIAHEGRLSPGPDYKLYLAPKFIETEADFLAIKDQSVRIGDIKTFDGFLLPVPPGVDVGSYAAAVVWCEAFGQFISAAKYR